MDKLKMHSPDSTKQKIARLAELFPNCVTESEDGDGQLEKAIDFDQLRQELSVSVVDGPRERYHLDWPGKKEALLVANAPIAKTLRPCRDESVDFDTTKNLFIEGDNLDALKLLQETYLNKVKMIYIDPPYNTGNDFIYADNFASGKKDYERESEQRDDEGGRLVTNVESNGRFHSTWLSMMYSRLRLARTLLSDEGMIFISIDDNESANLKKLCDEVFGEHNYVNTISLNAKVSAGASGGGEDKRLKKNIEYLLVYIKDFHASGPLTPIYKDSKLTDYIQKMKLDGKSFKYTNILYRRDDVQHYGTIKDGSGNDITLHKVNDYEIKTVKQIAKEENLSEEDVYGKYYDKVMTTTNAQTSIRTRVWEATDNDNTMYIAKYVPKSGKNKGHETEILFMGRQKVLIIWLKDTTTLLDGAIYKREKIGTYWDGISWINVTKEGELPFPNGKKPIALIQRMLNLCTVPHESAIVLDFFAGSGSVAHAVANQNGSDGGDRRCISIQIPEPISAKDKKKYYSTPEFGCLNTVCDISKERIRRAGQKLKDDAGLLGQEVDVGFRVLRIDTSNMKDVYYVPDGVKQGDLIDQIENIKEDRTPEDLLFQVLLDWGVDLSLPIAEETIEGKTVFFVDGDALAACFDKDINEELVKTLAARKPLRAVFRDSGYGNDSVKINVEQIFTLISPSTEVKSI